jgi:hypothetical protein
MINLKHEIPTAAARRRLAALLVVGFALALVSCNSSTDPDPGDGAVTRFTFLPEQHDLALLVGDIVQFSAAADPADGAATTWYRDGIAIGNTSSYTYSAQETGVDSVRVVVRAGADTGEYYWALTIADDPDLRPPALTALSVFDGDDPIEVVLSWTPVTATHDAIADYVVAVSYDGMVTDANWGDAIELGAVPHVPGVDVYLPVFDRDTAGIRAGEGAWFAVRVRDVAGRLSAIALNRYHVITDEWWIEGQVLADSLRTAIGGVIVRSLNPQQDDNTDLSGWYRLGPYRSTDSVQVQTVSDGYYDFVSPYMHYPPDPTYDIVLIERYVLSAECDTELDFLDYLRHVANKKPNLVDPLQPRRLWKPEDYPLRWYAPDTTTVRGVPLDDLCRSAVARWDSTLGEPYFTEVGSAAEATVIFQYMEMATAYGRTVLLDPPGFSYGEGAVIPETIGVRIVPDLPNLDVQAFSVFFEEVALHELGHVLGFLAHSPCDLAYDHLMRDAGGGGSLARPDPIHIDEQRAVRAVRYLPQGVDMNGYRAD